MSKSIFYPAARALAQGVCAAITHFCCFLIAGLRPLLGPATCKFPIGCTQFALECLQTQPLSTACINITQRLLSCRPF